MRNTVCSFVLSCVIAVSAQGQPTGIVYGRVLSDSAQRPIPEAAVSLDSGSISTLTDSLGRFRIVGVPPGRHAIAVRRIGFAPVAATLHLSPGDSVDAEFRLVPAVQPLPGVDVTASLLERKLSGFEERRRLGIGHFLSLEGIQKAPGSRLSEKVRALPGILVVYSRTGPTNQVRIATWRGPQGFRQEPCWARVMLDGVEVPELSINSIDPSMVSAIEWYGGPSQIPAQYNRTGNACALLMIWLK